MGKFRTLCASADADSDNDNEENGFSKAIPAVSPMTGFTPIRPRSFSETQIFRDLFVSHKISAEGKRTLI